MKERLLLVKEIEGATGEGEVATGEGRQGRLTTGEGRQRRVEWGGGSRESTPCTTWSPSPSNIPHGILLLGIIAGGTDGIAGSGKQRQSLGAGSGGGRRGRDRPC